MATIPVLVSPAPGGAHNWHPMAYSPTTGLVYFPVTRGLHVLCRGAELRSGQGPGSARPSAATTPSARRSPSTPTRTRGLAGRLGPGEAEGSLARRPVRATARGGVLATAGDLVFQGTIGKTFAAYRADDGEKLWEMPVQTVPVAGADHLRRRRRAICRRQRRLGRRPRPRRALQFQPAPGLGKPRLLVFKLGGHGHPAADGRRDESARARRAAQGDRHGGADRAGRTALRPALRAMPRRRRARRDQGLAP